MPITLNHVQKKTATAGGFIAECLDFIGSQVILLLRMILCLNNQVEHALSELGSGRPLG